MCIRDSIMGAFNEVQEGFRQINEAENRVDLQSGSIRENSADKIKDCLLYTSLRQVYLERLRYHVQLR